MADLVSQEEMAWREYIAVAVLSEEKHAEFARESGRPEVVLPDQIDWNNAEHMATLAEYHEWMNAFTLWLSSQWGGQFTPAWLQRARSH